jgi:ribonuclease BN (tRNA processing enzyme)
MRLTKYLSPPLFPVRLRDLPSHVQVDDVPRGAWTIGASTVRAAGIVHPGPTVGYRIERNGVRIAYLPDHEPALAGLTAGPAWTSGFDLIRDVDVLLHDGQYTDDEYRRRVGWGHSSISHAAHLADLAGVRELVLTHHDPDHSDAVIDAMVASAAQLRRSGKVSGASEGMVLEL